MDKSLSWFFRLWVALVVLLNLTGILGAALSSVSLGAFVQWMQETYSPFNIWTHGLNIALLLPAFGALIWRNKRREKESN